MFKAFKQRRPWAAILIELVFSPFVAMLYLNRGGLALVYLAADFVVVITVLAAVSIRIGHSPEPIVWLARTPLLLIGGAHAYWLSKRWRDIKQRHWYSHWHSILGILLLFPLTALLIRTFLFQPFDIPSTSMSPTLNQGDYFWASKLAYSKNEPQRGDMIVFHALAEGGGDYVKRIVGLPGDRIQMRDGVLHINGVPALQRRVADFQEQCGEPWPCKVRQFAETLPGGRREFILDRVPGLAGDDTPVFSVPAGSYFVLGDNRDNSVDSRNGLGFVRRDDIIGKVSRKFIANGQWVWEAVN